MVTIVIDEVSDNLITYRPPWTTLRWQQWFLCRKRLRTEQKQEVGLDTVVVVMITCFGKSSYSSERNLLTLLNALLSNSPITMNIMSEQLGIIVKQSVLKIDSLPWLYLFL